MHIKLSDNQLAPICSLWLRQSRFPLRASLKEEVNRVKNLMYQRYVRFFHFLGDVFERIKKQVTQT